MEEKEMPRGFVCGPLAELPKDEQRNQRRFYDEVGDVFLHTTGQTACVPHEHFSQETYDQQQHEVARREHCKDAWCLVIVCVPGWNGWINELTVAVERNIPVILVSWHGYLDRRQIPTSLFHHPSVKAKIIFFTKDEALAKLERVIIGMWQEHHLGHNVQPALALV